MAGLIAQSSFQALTDIGKSLRSFSPSSSKTQRRVLPHFLSFPNAKIPKLHRDEKHLSV